MSGTGILLDTHIWVRFGNRSPLLRKEALKAIDRGLAMGAVFVSVISVWEVALLVKLNRLSIPFSIERWVEQALALPGLQLLPITPQIAITSVNLPSTMNKDPADRILIASARVENLALITADSAVLKFAQQTGLGYIHG